MDIDIERIRAIEASYADIDPLEAYYRKRSLDYETIGPLARRMIGATRQAGCKSHRLTYNAKYSSGVRRRHSGAGQTPRSPSAEVGGNPRHASLLISCELSYFRTSSLPRPLFAVGGTDAANSSYLTARPSWPGRRCGGCLPKARQALMVNPDSRFQCVG